MPDPTKSLDDRARELINSTHLGYRVGWQREADSVLRALLDERAALAQPTAPVPVKTHGSLASIIDQLALIAYRCHDHEATDALDALVDRIKAQNNSAPAGARWYCLNAIGQATLCQDEANAIREAVKNAALYPHLAPYRAVQMAPLQAPTAPNPDISE